MACTPAHHPAFLSVTDGWWTSDARVGPRRHRAVRSHGLPEHRETQRAQQLVSQRRGSTESEPAEGAVKGQARSAERPPYKRVHQVRDLAVTNIAVQIPWSNLNTNISNVALTFCIYYWCTIGTICISSSIMLLMIWATFYDA